MVSTLHLEIVEIKNVYNHMVSEAQATCEGYTSRYFEVENDIVIGKVRIDEGTGKIADFKRVNGQYEMQLKDESKTTRADNQKESM